MPAKSTALPQLICVGILFLMPWVSSAEPAPAILLFKADSIKQTAEPFGKSGPSKKILEGEIHTGLFERMQQRAPEIQCRLNGFSKEETIVELHLQTGGNPAATVYSNSQQKTGKPSVWLAVRGDTLTGKVTWRGRTHLLNPAADDKHALLEANPNQVPVCGSGPLTVRSTAAATGPHPIQALDEITQLQDVDDSVPVYLANILVVYTSDARTAAGGTDGMNALIDLAEAEANTILADSLANLRVSVVHREEVDYQESGNLNTDLTSLRNRFDRVLESVHSLRDRHDADLVSLIVESSNNNVAGIAYIMSPISQNFAVDAFSVTQRPFILSHHAWLHELGHNLGCNHDPDNAASQGAFEDSLAHRFNTPDGTRHTVMAYGPGTIAPLFSNPNVLLDGVPSGVVGEADNVRTINLAASTVAGFRSPAASRIRPSITFNFPEDGSSFYGGVTLTTTVEVDNFGEPVSHVDFFQQSNLVETDVASPYEALLPDLTGGPYQLRARAYGALAIQSELATTAFTVGNPAPQAVAGNSIVLPGTEFHLGVSGSTGQIFAVDVSDDLENWTPVSTNVLESDTVQVPLPLQSAGSGFYRVRPVTPISP